MNEPYDTSDPMTFVREGVSDLAVYLDMWRNRRPLPELDRPARVAADLAVERLDLTVKRLDRIRARLVEEMTIQDAAWRALDDEPHEPYDPRD